MKRKEKKRTLSKSQITCWGGSGAVALLLDMFQKCWRFLKALEQC